VGVALLNAHVPRALLHPTQQILDPGARAVRRQYEPSARDVLSQRSQQLAPEQHPDHADRQQVAVADGLPALGCRTASRDQDMEMGMEAQGPPPGVQRRQDSRAGSQVLRILEQLEQRVAHRAEQVIDHPLAVRVPQRLELVREREHDMVVVAGEQLLTPGVEPAIDPGPRALRTRSMSTRVVVNLDLVAFRAAPHVAAHRGGAASENRTRGAVQVQWKPARPCMLRKPEAEHLLQGDRHA
jgi:hypothetical protein